MRKRYRQRRFRAGTHADRIEDQGRDSGGDRRFDHGGNNRSKNSREKAGGYSKELSEKLFEKKNDTKESFKEPSLKKVLATIVSRKGSAPRSVGTKMLIMEDGSITGTIGGGCVESEVMQKALLMMRKGEPVFQLCKVDMTADDAEEEGMVCGGVVEVMLEMI